MVKTRKVPKGWKLEKGATTAPAGYVIITNRGSRFTSQGDSRHCLLISEEDYEWSLLEEAENAEA